MIKLCGLWEKQKDGKRYLSGSLGGARIVILPNNYKKEEKHPDYNLFVAAKERGEGGQEKSERPAPSSGVSRSYSPPPPEDDIPF